MKNSKFFKKAVSVTLVLMMVVSMFTMALIPASAFNMLGTVYFDNSDSQWSDAYVYIGHGGYLAAYKMTPVEKGSNIYSYDFDGWNNASGIYFASELVDTSGKNVNQTRTELGLTVRTSLIEDGKVNYIYKAAEGTNATVSYTGTQCIDPKVLDGTNVMFYAGQVASWGTTSNIYVRTSSDTTSTLASARGTEIGSVGGIWIPVSLPGERYYLSNSGSWGGIQMAQSAVSGRAYQLNSDGGNNVKTIAGASISGTTLSEDEVIIGDDFTITTTTTSNQSSIGTSLSLSVYKKDIVVPIPFATGSDIANNEGTVTINSDSLGEGTHELIPVISDGNIFIPGAAITVTIVSGVDKEALGTAIAEADALGTTNPGYTEDTWVALQTALTAAKEIFESRDVTQEQIDEATKNLTEALSNLEFAVTPPTNVTLTGRDSAKVGEEITLTAFAEVAEGDLTLSTVFDPVTDKAELKDNTTTAPKFVASAPGTYSVKLNATNTLGEESATVASSIHTITVEYSDTQNAYNNLELIMSTALNPEDLKAEDYLSGQVAIDNYKKVYDEISPLLTGLPEFDSEDIYTDATDKLEEAIKDLNDDLKKTTVYFKTTVTEDIYFFAFRNTETDFETDSCSIDGFNPMKLVATEGANKLWSIEFEGTTEGIFVNRGSWGGSVKYSGDMQFLSPNKTYFHTANSADDSTVPQDWSSLSAELTKINNDPIFENEAINLNDYFSLSFSGTISSSGSLVSYVVNGSVIEGSEWTPTSKGTNTIKAIVNDGYKTEDSEDFQRAITNEIEINVYGDIEKPTITLTGSSNAEINQLVNLTVEASNATSISDIEIISGNKEAVTIGGTVMNPVFSATEKGTYVLEVTATNTDGVQTIEETATLTIVVTDPNEYEIYTDKTSIVRGESFTLSTIAPSSLGENVTYTFEDELGNIIGSKDQSENSVEVIFTDRFMGTKTYKVTAKGTDEETLTSVNSVDVEIEASFIPGDILYFDRNTTWGHIAEGEKAFIDLADTQGSGSRPHPETSRSLLQLTDRLHIYVFAETHKGTIKFYRGNDDSMWNTTRGMTSDDYCSTDQYDGISIKTDEYTGAGSLVKQNFTINAPKPTVVPDELNIPNSVLITSDPTLSYNDVLGENVTEELIGKEIYTLMYKYNIGETTDVISNPLEWTPTTSGVYNIFYEITIPFISKETVTSENTVVKVNEEIYTITANVNPEESGTATVNGLSSVDIPATEEGSTVDLVATPAEGYVFVNWTNSIGDVVSTSAEFSTKVSGSENYIANFAKTHTVTVIYNSTEGTVSNDKGTTIIDGESIELTATALEGYSFKDWTVETTDDGTYVDTNNPLSLVVTSDVTITANFEKANITAPTVTIVAEESEVIIGNTAYITAKASGSEIEYTDRPNEPYTGQYKYVIYHNDIEISSVIEDSGIEAKFQFDITEENNEFYVISHPTEVETGSEGTSETITVKGIKEVVAADVKVSYVGEDKDLLLGKTIRIEAGTDIDEFNNLVKDAVYKNAPTITNVYNNILFNVEDYETSEFTKDENGRITSVKVFGKPERRTFNITLMNESGAVIEQITREYQLIEDGDPTPNPNGLVEWSAEELGLVGDSFIWYTKDLSGNEIILRVGLEYGFYVTGDTTVYVKEGTAEVQEDNKVAIYNPTLENKIINKDGIVTEQITFLFLSKANVAPELEIESINQVGIMMMECDENGNVLREEIETTNEKLSEYYEAYADGNPETVKPKGVNFFMCPAGTTPNGAGFYYTTITMTNNEANQARYFKAYACFEITDESGNISYIVSENSVIATMGDYYKK